MARDLLRVSDGIVFGEKHDQISTNVMLIKNMQAYAESGVTTLYLEGAYWDIANGVGGYGRRPPMRKV